MLATIRDETWDVLNMQHVIPNSKRWDYSDIPSGGQNRLKGPSHMAEGGHHLRKAPHPHPHVSGGLLTSQESLTEGPLPQCSLSQDPRRRVSQKAPYHNAPGGILWRCENHDNVLQSIKMLQWMKMKWWRQHPTTWNFNPHPHPPPGLHIHFLGHLSDETSGCEDPLVHHAGLLFQPL